MDSKSNRPQNEITLYGVHNINTYSCSIKLQNPQKYYVTIDVRLKRATCTQPIALFKSKSHNDCNVIFIDSVTFKEKVTNGLMELFLSPLTWGF